MHFGWCGLPMGVMMETYAVSFMTRVTSGTLASSMPASTVLPTLGSNLASLVILVLDMSLSWLAEGVLALRHSHSVLFWDLVLAVAFPAGPPAAPVCNLGAFVSVTHSVWPDLLDIVVE